MKRIITSFAFFITFVSLTFSCLAQESEATQSLIEAIRLGDLPRLQSLVAENVDLNAKDDSSNTALLYAINADRLDIVKLLLDNGANTNQKLKDGGTVLISVIETNHPKALERVFPPIPEEVIFLMGVFGGVYDKNEGNNPKIIDIGYPKTGIDDDYFTRQPQYETL